MLFDHGGNSISFEKEKDFCGCKITAEKWNKFGVLSEIKITLFREEIEQLIILLSKILERRNI